MGLGLQNFAYWEAVSSCLTSGVTVNFVNCFTSGLGTFGKGTVKDYFNVHFLVYIISCNGTGLGFVVYGHIWYIICCLMTTLSSK